eukprot:COSAG02_NODE_22117_length_762_cov_11.966817_1_plen_150_part_01
MDAHQLAIAVRLVTVAAWQAGVADAAWACPSAPYSTDDYHALFEMGCSPGDGAWCAVTCEAGYEATTPWTETDTTGVERKNSYYCHCETGETCYWMRGDPAHYLGCQPVQCLAEAPAPHARSCGAGKYGQPCDTQCDPGYTATPGGSAHY